MRGLLLCALAGAAAAEQAVGGLPAKSRLVVLEQTHQGLIVAVSQPSRHLPDVFPERCSKESQWSRYASIPDGHHRYNAEFETEHDGSARSCVQIVHTSDPNRARVFHDWLRDPQERAGFWGRAPPQMQHDGAVLDDREEVYALHLPLDVRKLVIDHGNSTREHLQVPTQHRAARTTALAAPVLLDSETQTAAPILSDLSNAQSGGNMNIVFISGGYKTGGPEADAQSRFKANIRKGIDFLQFPTNYGLPNADIAIARYFSSFNVFAVFQESNDDGASKPAQGISVDNNLGCTYGDGTSSSPARALTCPRAQVIAMADVAPVTTASKNVLVVVLVNDVDYGGTGVYREGVVKYGTFYNAAMESSDPSTEKSAASLLYHEINHAYADLSDEYTVGITYTNGYNCKPTSTATFPSYGQWGFYEKYNAAAIGQAGRRCEKNCASSTTDLGWQKWLPSQQGNANTGQVDATPGEGCYYNNWYKPGTGRGEPCLMEALAAPYLCPVCREAGTLQLYTNGMDLTFPSCPHPGWTVTYVAQSGAGSKATFFANDRLFGDVSVGVGKPETSVQWQVDTVSQSGAVHSYFILDASTANGGLSVGAHHVRAVVRDQSTWVLADHQPPSMREVTIEWQVQVMTSATVIESELIVQGIQSANHLSECESRGSFFQSLLPSTTAGFPLDSTINQYNPYLHYRRCTGTILSSETYNCTCLSRKDCACLADSSSTDRKCSLSYQARAYENPKDLSDTVDDIEGWLFGIGGGATLGGIVVVVILHVCLASHFGRTPSRVLEDRFTGYIEITRKIMMVSAVCFAVLSLGGMIGILVLYNQVGAVVQIALVALGVFCLAMFLMSLAGFFAAYYRSLVLLMMNGVLLALAVSIQLCVACFMYVIGYDSNDTGSKAQRDFEDEWRSGVRNKPDQICTLQDLFGCSGWSVPCNQFQAGDNCPANCEATNARYGTTCKVEVLSWVHEYFPIAGSCFMALFYAVLIGCLLNYLLWTAIKKSDDLNSERMSLLMDGPLQSLLTIIHYHSGSAESFNERCLKQFHKMDTDKSGELDRGEFKRFFKSITGIDSRLERAKMPGQWFGRPRRRDAFAQGIYAEHQERGPGIVEGVTDKGVTIRFQSEHGTHTYKDKTLAKGQVQPGFGPPRDVADFADGMFVVHERRGHGQVVSVADGVKVQFDSCPDAAAYIYRSQALHRAVLQPADWEDPRKGHEEVSDTYFDEKLDALFDLFDLDESGTIRLDEWVRVNKAAAHLGAEPALGQYLRRGKTQEDFERDHAEWEERYREFDKVVEYFRKDMLEQVEDRRSERLEQADASRDTAQILDVPAMEPTVYGGATRSELECWRMLGVLSDSQWASVVESFNLLAAQDAHSGSRVVFCDVPDTSSGVVGFKQYLERTYGPVLNSSRLSSVFTFSKRKAWLTLGELPNQCDYNGDGVLTFSEWVASFYRRAGVIEKFERMRQHAGAERSVLATDRPKTASGLQPAGEGRRSSRLQRRRSTAASMPYGECADADQGVV
eukprot:TRINITY_DN47906_c0_g1_i1.p1 TRINITY_DN47906_c0_g1~~TRINITY_DN47906_c0_g1_i1.p1  ORF type:complete len:1513 (+),score=420.09 TRINITY_DN47906_c0_g1_i1:64-4602(+)